MVELKSRPLCHLELTLGAMIDAGETPFGRRRIVPITGGRFEGERLRGEVMPDSGSDWLLARTDGAMQQDVRLVLRTHDGAIVSMTYRGVRATSEAVATRLAKGERVSPDEYYFRTAPFFETAAPAYAWLNRIVCVAMGDRMPDAVAYDVFEIL